MALCAMCDWCTARVWLNRRCCGLLAWLAGWLAGVAPARSSRLAHGRPARGQRHFASLLLDYYMFYWVVAHIDRSFYLILILCYGTAAQRV